MSGLKTLFYTFICAPRNNPKYSRYCIFISIFNQLQKIVFSCWDWVRFIKGLKRDAKNGFSILLIFSYQAFVVAAALINPVLNACLIRSGSDSLLQFPTIDRMRRGLCNPHPFFS